MLVPSVAEGPIVIGCVFQVPVLLGSVLRNSWLILAQFDDFELVVCSSGAPLGPRQETCPKQEQQM